MKILVFTEGTIIMHESASGKKRKEIVKQVIDKDPSVKDYSSYIPVGHAAEKISKWKEQGAKILFLTSRTKTKEVSAIKDVLRSHGFGGRLISRKRGQKYHDVAQRSMPDMIVEDDIESGGEGGEQSVYGKMKPQLKKKIKHIVVKEFGGIDHLPDKLSELKNYRA